MTPIVDETNPARWASSLEDGEGRPLLEGAPRACPIERELCPAPEILSHIAAIDESYTVTHLLCWKTRHTQSGSDLWADAHDLDLLAEPFDRARRLRTPVKATGNSAQAVTHQHAHRLRSALVLGDQGR